MHQNKIIISTNIKSIKEISRWKRTEHELGLVSLSLLSGEYDREKFESSSLTNFEVSNGMKVFQLGQRSASEPQYIR